MRLRTGFVLRGYIIFSFEPLGGFDPSIAQTKGPLAKYNLYTLIEKATRLIVESFLDICISHKYTQAYVKFKIERTHYVVTMLEPNMQEQLPDWLYKEPPLLGVMSHSASPSSARKVAPQRPT